MLQRKEWEDLRAEIENIIKEHDISSADFKALDIHEEWHQIEENIYRPSCQLNHPTVHLSGFGSTSNLRLRVL